jgi:hypothetical protein
VSLQEESILAAGNVERFGQLVVVQAGLETNFQNCHVHWNSSNNAQKSILNNNYKLTLFLRTF